MKKLQVLAARGIIPRKLSKCPIPVCKACLYGKATKRPWRQKKSEDEQKEVHMPTEPGECISVDLMTSPTPGLVAQMSGRPTYLRYKHAAIYVDQATGHGFVWLQKTISSEETLKGKVAFERYCDSYGVLIRHYHADNGIFSANAWRNSCQE